MHIGGHYFDLDMSLKSIFMPKIVKNRERLEDWIVFIFFIGLTWIFAWQRVFPYMYDDEYGVLGAAAVLSGHDWSAPAGMPFYGFVLSLLSIPFYFFELEPTSLYRAVLSVNGVLVALSAILTLRSLRMMSLPIDSSLQILIVIAAFSYPSVFHYSQMANGETALLFAFSLAVFSIVALTSEHMPRAIFAFFLGLSIALAPYAHSRGIVFSLAMVVVVFLVFRKGLISLKSISIALLAVMLISSILGLIKGYLAESFYSEVRHGTVSTVDFIASKISLFDYDALPDIFLVFAGQAAYLATSSFGLVFIGVIAALTPLMSIAVSGRYMKYFPVIIWDKKAIAGVFVGLSSLLMFLVSAIQMSTPVRADHFFYGRYNEVMTPWLIIIALISLSVLHERLKFSRGFMLFIVGVVLLIFSMIIVLLFPAEIFDRVTYWNTLTGWFVHTQGEWKIIPLHILLGTLTGSMWLLIAFFLSKRFFAVALMAMFVVAAIHNYTSQHRSADRSWVGYGLLASKYSHFFAGDVFYIYNLSDSGLGNLQGEALQFALPQSKVVFASDSSSSEAYKKIVGVKGDHCFSPKILKGALLCVQDPISLVKILDAFESIDESQKSLKNIQPAKITFELSSSNIEASGAFVRFCAKMQRYFYSSWARFCLPDVDISISINDLRGTEKLSLGLFISDNSGKWHAEWREELDAGALSRNQFARINVPIRFDANMRNGEYKLNAAIVDDDGWDWRSSSSIKFDLN